jgi:aminoglycoside phosphotransferase family enzyme/predicted kinase
MSRKSKSLATDLSGALAWHAQLVRELLDAGCYPHPVAELEVIETHISSVILTGEFAYKLKKPLDLGFLDFSSLEKRRHCCEEELRLNRRTAPDLYLDVAPVTRTVTGASICGDGPVIDYAVKMRQFRQQSLLSERQRHGTLTDDLLQRVGDVVAAFHERIPTAAEDSDFGSPAAVVAPMRENFRQIRAVEPAKEDLRRLLEIERWTEEKFKRVQPVLAARKAGGHVRECHGDMHLGNVLEVGGKIVVFDGIEFNARLRWIDTISEVAFLVMDLEHAGERALGRRFLDTYLDATGDFAGLELLSFYKVYRAMVRAKVAGIQWRESGDPFVADHALVRQFRSYLDLAESYLKPGAPILIITHGLSGSGKSTLASGLLDVLPALRVRSDVERKRLFGFNETDRSGSAPAGGIYTAAATERTYARLADVARHIVSAGYHALVDAAFLRRGQRRQFRALAEALGVPMVILDLQADSATLVSRLDKRQAQGHDASDADANILRSQLETREMLDAVELEHAVKIDAGAPFAAGELAGRIASRARI